MEKRKPGRPAKMKPAVHIKKQSIAEVRKELEELHFLNNAILNGQLQHEEMHAQVVQSLNAQLNEAYDQHTYMLTTVSNQLSYLIQHLANIEYHAGSLTLQDVEGSVDVLSRIMHNKFGKYLHQEEI
jgi:hypothetical protein